MLRVLHIFQTLTGGSATILEEIAAAQLTELGAGNVAFLIPREQRAQVPDLPDATIMTFANGDRTILGLSQFYMACRDAVQRFVPDILHLHSTFPGVLCRLPFLFKRNRPKIIYCAHGWSFDREVVNWKCKLSGSVERALSSVTDAIVNVSKSDFQSSLRYNLPRERSYVILNGISDYLWKVGQNSRENNGRVRMVFVGRFDRQKGLDILFQRLPALGMTSFEIDIVGDYVTEKPRQTFVGSENVRFHGWLPRFAAGHLIHQADVVIMPSRWEAFGLVAIEAMMLESAVLASNRGALPEIVEDGVSGRIFDLDDAGQFVSILQGTTKEDWVAMGRAGRKRYEEKFTARRMNAELLQLYRYIVAWEPAVSDAFNRVPEFHYSSELHGDDSELAGHP